MELANEIPLKKRVEGEVYAERLYFLVVIFAIEDVPFLRAFENGSLLGVDFCPGCKVDPGFLIEQLFENLSGFLAGGVGVFDELPLVHLLENVRDGAGQYVHFVAAEPHSTALYLRTSSVFTLRN